MNYVENKKITNPKPVTETPEQKALRLHRASPLVYAKFESMALQAIKANAKVGTNMIVNVMRWRGCVEQQGSIYKVDNDCAPYYARWFMKKHPQHAGFFKTRKLQNES